MIEASAPAKIILFGEHAVVYSQPAIAVPLSSLRAKARAAANHPPGQGLRLVAPDLGIALEFGKQPALDNPLAEVAQTILSAIGAPPPDVTIQLNSDIPLASGLGSGAAISTVLARVLSAAVSQPFTQERLNEVVYQTEVIHHGTPSGIDNTVIVYEQPVYFVRDLPIETIHIAQPFHLVVADTGIHSPTRIPVGDVRKLYEAEPGKISPILSEIGHLVRQARQAIEGGNIPVLGPLMNRNHALLQQLTVSSPELDRLVAAAINAGALGAKLSGAGRGGNMITLVTSDTVKAVEEALKQTGAARVFATLVGSQDVHH